MSERKSDNLPHVKPFVDTAFTSEGHIRYGTPGAKREIVKAIVGLMGNNAKDDTRPNTSGFLKENIKNTKAVKITAVRTAVSLINKDNPNQITGEQKRDMVAAIVFEGSPAIPSINFSAKPEKRLLLSTQEVAESIRQKRQTQLNQKAEKTIPELDTKQ